MQVVPVQFLPQCIDGFVVMDTFGRSCGTFARESL